MFDDAIEYIVAGLVVLFILALGSIVVSGSAMVLNGTMAGA